jgi:hypothetical protein
VVQVVHTIATDGRRHFSWTSRAVIVPSYASARLVAITVPDRLGDHMGSNDTTFDEQLAAAAQRRAAARARDLSALLRQRPDLAGVHAPADFTLDGVRWCA